jgi:hypothetical protein
MFDYHSMDELAAQDAGWDAGYAGEPITPTTNLAGYRAGRQAYHDDLEVGPIVPSYQDLEDAAWDAGFSGEGTINRVGYWLGVMAYHTDMGRKPCPAHIREEIGVRIRELGTSA